MSATNRGSVRATDDCYITKPELCAAIVDALIQHKVVLVTDNELDICEPSAGAGMFVRELKRQLNCRVTAVEINSSFKKKLKQAGADRVVIDDWLIHEEKYDLIVGNPPFIEAEEHVRHAARLLKPCGAVAFLLRIGFLGSSGRIDFWKKYRPTWVFPITPRPSFLTSELEPVVGKNGKKGVDGSEYAVFVWTQTGLLTYDKKNMFSQLGGHILWEPVKTPRQSSVKKRPSKKRVVK